MDTEPQDTTAAYIRSLFIDARERVLLPPASADPTARIDRLITTLALLTRPPPASANPHAFRQVGRATSDKELTKLHRAVRAVRGFSATSIDRMAEEGLLRSQLADVERRLERALDPPPPPPPPPPPAPPSDDDTALNVYGLLSLPRTVTINEMLSDQGASRSTPPALRPPPELHRQHRPRQPAQAIARETLAAFIELTGYDPTKRLDEQDTANAGRSAEEARKWWIKRRPK
jgi:hypothetical protein